METFCAKDYDMKFSFEISEDKYCQQVTFLDDQSLAKNKSKLLDAQIL